MRKKGQEEIVGFVVIVLLVALVALIFLGITLRQEKPTESLDNLEISHFLESLMRTSTECSLNYIPSYLRTSELVNVCAEQPIRECLNGKKVCEELEGHLTENIEKSWVIGENRPLKGWKFSIAESGNESNIENILQLNRGNCTGFGIKGGSFLISGERNALKVIMSVCGSS